MKIKPIIIVAGEPYSIFSEIFFKLYKSKILNNFKAPLVLIGSKNIFKAQMKKLKYKLKFNQINIKDINNFNLIDKYINIINVNFNFKKSFDKISSISSNYISKCFKIAFTLIKSNKANILINGPISKKHFLNKKYLGITEYLSKKTQSKKKPVMLIYNSNLSVCPITTHLPIKYVSKNLSKKKIINNVLEIQNFYKNILKKKAKFAVLGLNPHCESIGSFNEEDKIINPAIKFLKKKKININGPFPADTFFIKKNLINYNIVIGMYHDQVLTPLKTLYKFDAINISLGLPFLRLSPDHGPNNEMIGKKISDPKSLFSIINFLKKIK